MTFNSYIFILVFLPLALSGYYWFRKKGMHTQALLFLTGMSFWFYGYFNAKYLLILCGSILFNWFVSLFLNRRMRGRKAALAVGVVGDVILIFVFKYYDFFLANINKLCGTSFPLRHILLPLGISFFTFQQISYLVDSYRGETADYHFFEYTAYISFFPQLVAGPIVLHDEMIPQLRDESRFNFRQECLAEGIWKFSAGLFKKVLLADVFGRAVSWGFTHLSQMSAMEILLVMLSYTFEIYFDFSAYSDMAIGIGKMFGIDFPINFNSPYKATSILEFWERWHMTLTRFLRKYIYYPLGGNRKGTCRTYLNVMVVYIVSGIWHGANWTYILWGVLHGVASVLNRMFKKQWDKCGKIIRWVCTFAFINGTMFLFRAESVRQASDLMKRLFHMDSLAIHSELMDCFKLVEVDRVMAGIPLLRKLPENIGGFYMWIYLFAALAGCMVLDNLHEKKFRPTMGKAILSILFLCWSLVSFAGVTTFLYFNF